MVPPGEAHPQPASRGGGGRDGRQRGWGSPASPAPSPAAGGAPAPLPEPVPLAVPPDGEVRGGSGLPAGTAGPGVRCGLPAEPPLRVPPLRAREPGAGKGGGCRGWTPFPLAAPRERHGAFSLAQPWNQPFSRDSGDNLCFPAPRVRAGAGAGLAQGPGAAAALGTPRSRRALAACGGCGGPGCGPSSGGTLAARLRAQPARRSECHPGVLPGSPAHGLQFLTGGISPSWELQGWPGCWAGEIWACGASGCKDSVPSCAVSSWLRVPVSDTDIILFSFLFWRALWLIYL